MIINITAKINIDQLVSLSSIRHQRWQISHKMTLAGIAEFKLW